MMNQTTILIVGRTEMVLDNVRKHMPSTHYQFLSATDLDGVKKAFGSAKPDLVIMGASIDLEPRLAIIRYVFERSGSTSMHLKDTDSGPEGFLPFLKGMPSGLQGEPAS